jgi:hypothetical protein
MTISQPSENASGRDISCNWRTFPVADDRIYLFLRIAKRGYIDAFSRGELWMNPLSFFSQMEGDIARGDPHEGDGLWMQPTTDVLSVKIGETWVPISGLLGPISWRRQLELRSNVFCLSALPVEAEVSFDSRNHQFGDTVAFLTDPHEFLRRVRQAATAHGFNLMYRGVEYVDPRVHSGEMGLFRKSSEFSHQREFRIALSPGKGAPYTLLIGDISDLVAVAPVEQLGTIIASIRRAG